jgi:chromosome segregation ATPase
LYESLILLIPSIPFLILVVILSYKSYYKIIHATKEYNEAKQLVSNIIFTFRKRIDEQNEKIDNSTYYIEELQSSIENSKKQEKYFQERLNNLITSVISTVLTDKKLVDNLLIINDKIVKLKSTDEVLYDSIESLKKEQKEALIKPILKLPPDQGSNLVKLTRTERQVIQILLSEGAKTAPMIMEAIGKTREHTSRLMKKLWQEGYIERDTNNMPFTYRPTKELKKRVNIHS